MAEEIRNGPVVLDADPYAKRLVAPVVILGLTLLSSMIYGRVVNFDYVNYDDNLYVYDNPHVADGITWPSIRWAFKLSDQVPNWHPLTWLSHMADVELFGVEKDPNGGTLRGPGGHHLTSIVLHILNSVLLFVVFKVMTKRTWPAACVAALFAVHPMHVESVAWIAERKDVLSGLFWMLTMLAYVGYARRPGIGRYLLVVAVFAVGLMAKPMLVTLPCVLLLIDYWPLGRFSRVANDAGGRTDIHGNERTNSVWLVAEKLPLFGLVVLACAITYIAQQRAGAINSLQDAPMYLRLLNVPIAYASYVAKLFWPNNLSVLYPLDPKNERVWLSCFAVVFLMSVTAVAIVRRSRWPWLFVGWFWFLGTLVPVIGIIKIGELAYADRYTYLPSIGLSIVFAFGFREAIGHSQYGRIILGIAATGALAALSVCAWWQTGYWKDGVTLFSRAVAVDDGNATAYNNRGSAYFRRGDFRTALDDLDRAIELSPNYAFAYSNRGNTYQRMDKDELALRDYATSIELDPEQPRTYFNRANIHGDDRRFTLALEDYSRAIKVDPKFAVAYHARGIIYLRENQPTLALDDFTRAIELIPNWAAAYNNRGRVYRQLGNVSNAVDDFTRAINLARSDPRPFNNRGSAYRKLRKYDLAIADYAQAIKLDGEYAKAHMNLGFLLASCPDPRYRDGDRALKHAKQACELTAWKQAGPLAALAAACAETGRFDEAVRWQIQAIEIAPDALFRQRLEFYRAGKPCWVNPQYAPSNNEP